MNSEESHKYDTVVKNIKGYSDSSHMDVFARRMINKKMLTYWIFMLVPLVFVVLGSRFEDDLDNLLWIGMSATTVIVIGTRYEVGGDWVNYLAQLARAENRDFLSAMLANTEPGYGVVNWLSAKIGLGIYGVNLVCGGLFVTGLAIFCRRQPIPWLAWLVATPYLLVVVGMGYTRQIVALGFLLWGLPYLEDKRAWRYLLLLLIGAAFHKTVLLMAPMAILGWRGNVWFRVGGLVVICLALLWAGTNYRTSVYSNVVEPNALFRLWNKYIDKGQWSSVGASYRVWMNAIPAVLLLLLWRNWNKHFKHSEIWVWIAIASIGSVFFVGIASTAIDRINLYLAPIQLYFWTRLPMLVSDLITQTAMIFAICLIYIVSLWVWLSLANHAYEWIPYKSVLSI